jgi:signal transduction histidine kinase
MNVRFWLLTLTPLLALLSYAILVAVVIRRRVRSHLYRLFTLYLAIMAVWSFGSAMMRLDPAHILFWNKILIGSALAMPLVYFGFVQAFLDTGPSRWVRIGVVSLLGLEIGNALGLVVTDARLLEGGLLSFDAGPATYFATAYGVLCWGLSIWHLVRAYRRTLTPVMRNRIRYPLIGLFCVILGTSTDAVPELAALPVDHAANLINALLLAHAILRYQLLDITLVVRRGLLYFIPTIVIGAGYFLLIFFATRLFGISAEPRVVLLSLLLAVIAALVAEPLRGRAQLWIDRLFFREKYDSRLMLQRLSRTAAAMLDLGRLTNMILDEVIATMHIGRAAFFVKQEQRSEFCLMAGRGMDASAGMKLRTDHPVVEWLSEHEQALTRQDVEVVPQFKALWGGEREDLDQMGAELLIPLKTKGDLVGVLAVGPKLSEGSYSEDDQLTLTTLANQVAVAIENAWLYEQARQEIAERKQAEEALRQLNRNLAMLNRLGQEFSATLDLQWVTERVLLEATEIVGAVGASVWLWDEEREGWLACRAAFPDDQSHSLLGLRLQPGQGLVGCVAQTGESAVVVSAPDDVRFFGGVDEQTGFHTTSLLAVPLKARGEVIGVLEVVNKLSGDFSTDDAAVVETLAASAAIAIENARLHRELQDYAGQLEQRVRERTVQLQAQYARLETILRSTLDGIVVTDAQGEILQANPVAQDWLSRSLLPEDEAGLREAVRDLARQVSAGTHAEGLPEVMLELKGLDLELRGAPILGPQAEQALRPAQGEPTAVVDIHDVSHFKALDRMKTRFVSNVSHELRTPVTTVKLYAHLMKRQPDRWKEHLGTLAREADRQAQLVEDILQISRIDAGRLEMNPRLILLDELAETSVSSHLVLAQAQGLTLQHRRAALPEYWTGVQGRLTVLVDPERMMQVLNNLVENAIHYTPEGGVVVVSTSVKEDAGRVWATATVTDTGMGIPAAEEVHVFERFFRGEQPRLMQISGTGLGLAIAKEIVELHGGRMTVESKEGVGSTFTVWLPLHEQEAASRPRSPRGGSDARTRSARV